MQVDNWQLTRYTSRWLSGRSKRWSANVLAVGHIGAVHGRPTTFSFWCKSLVLLHASQAIPYRWSTGSTLDSNRLSNLPLGLYPG